MARPLTYDCTGNKADDTSEEGEGEREDDGVLYVLPAPPGEDEECPRAAQEESEARQEERPVDCKLPDGCDNSWVSRGRDMYPVPALVKTQDSQLG